MQLLHGCHFGPHTRMRKWLHAREWDASDAVSRVSVQNWRMNGDAARVACNAIRTSLFDNVVATEQGYRQSRINSARAYT